MTCKVTGTLLFLMLFACLAVAGKEASFSDPTTGMKFVSVKGGCFLMGDSVGDGDPNERPVREVCVSDFAIGQYEVTNIQYDLFRPNHDSGTSEGASLEKDNLPVVNVSWEDAVAYAEWLSQKSGQHYRLPTEAEWEYAARSGSKDNRFWGNSADEACKYANVADRTAKEHWAKWTTFQCSDGYGSAAPAGSFQPNGLGLYDMLGNAWEWCQDVYNAEAYSKLPEKTPSIRAVVNIESCVVVVGAMDLLAYAVPIVSDFHRISAITHLVSVWPRIQTSWIEHQDCRSILEHFWRHL